MLGLAIELRRRGHAVTFATNEHYGAVARRHGFPFEALGTEDDFRKCVDHPDLWQPRKAFGHVFRSLRPGLRRHYEMHAELAAKGPLAAVTNVFGFGAFMARETLKIPVVTLHCQPAVIWSDIAPPKMPGLAGPRWWRRILFRLGERFFIDPEVCPFFNAWRAEHGLAPVRNITRYWHSPDGIVCLFPDWFCPRQSDWPTPVAQADFPLWSDGSDRSLPDEVKRFLDAGEPPVVFTPGSANCHGEPFFRAAVDACRQMNWRGILLSEFGEQIPKDLPAGVVHYRYVPLELLLPRAKAFVHHGGVGSTSQAMAAGIPQVIVALAHDQFDNAARVASLNVGGSVGVKRITGPKLAKVLQRLCDDADVLAACRTVAGKLSRRDGLTLAADAAETMLGIKQKRDPG
jgi:rhamnosyltransferase subunit B